MAVTVWLARWSRQTKEEQQRHIYVVVLALLAVAAVLMSLFRAVLTFFSLVKVQFTAHECFRKPREHVANGSPTGDNVLAVTVVVRRTRARTFMSCRTRRSRRENSFA